jgi:hypothetical protein
MKHFWVLIQHLLNTRNLLIWCTKKWSETITYFITCSFSQTLLGYLEGGSPDLKTSMKLIIWECQRLDQTIFVGIEKSHQLIMQSVWLSHICLMELSYIGKYKVLGSSFRRRELVVASRYGKNSCWFCLWILIIEIKEIFIKWTKHGHWFHIFYSLNLFVTPIEFD